VDARSSISPRSVIWGIDPDTKRIAIAIRGLRDEQVSLQSLDIDADQLPEPERLYRMFSRLTIHAADWMKQGFPVCVCIEKPISARAMSDSLLHNYGVVLAALSSVFGTWTPNVAWLEVGASQWKKATLGSGTANTDDYTRMLRAKGVRFSNADEAAAYWLADYAAGRITYE
jgi:Holliday junction resolvasome RuvABC endonuclease subunit